MTRILLSVLLAVGFACATLAGETAAPKTKDAAKDWDEKKDGPRPAQLKCPITNTNVAVLMDGRFRPAVGFIAIEGFRFAVSRRNDAAEKAKEADPKDIFAALAKNGDAAVPVSPVCPVMGYKVKQDLYTQKDGRRIFVCCKGCIARVERRWDTMLAKVKELSEQPVPKDLKEM